MGYFGDPILEEIRLHTNPLGTPFDKSEIASQANVKALKAISRTSEISISTSVDLLDNSLPTIDHQKHYKMLNIPEHGFQELLGNRLASQSEHQKCLEVRKSLKASVTKHYVLISFCNGGAFLGYLILEEVHVTINPCGMPFGKMTRGKPFVRPNALGFPGSQTPKG